MPDTNEQNFYKWFGSKYQTIREKKGLKQKEVAEQAGIGQGELSKFENRGKKLSAYRISKLLEAIGIRFEEILDEDAKKNSRLLSIATS